MFTWECVFAGLDCVKGLLFLSIPLSHHVYLIFKGQQTQFWDICCFLCIKAPHPNPPALPSSLAPASCWLTLWRQVRSNVLTLCKNTSNAPLPM